MTYRDAARTAQGLLNAIGKTTKPSIAIEVALIEMMAHDVRERVHRPACFLQHPAHLPEGEELRRLMSSPAAKDTTLRADAREWADVNKREAGRAAVSLRNMVRAIRQADALLNGGELADEDETKVHGWMNEIADYAREVFECDPREAPADAIDAWATSICNRANPCPEWLQNYHQLARTAPVKTDGTVAGEFARYMTTGEDKDDD